MVTSILGARHPEGGDALDGSSSTPDAGEGRGSGTPARTLPTNAASRELDGLSSELSQNSELSSDATENWKSPGKSKGEGHNGGMWCHGLSPSASLRDGETGMDGRR